MFTCYNKIEKKKKNVQYLYEVRKRAGITQCQLADTLNVSQ